MEPNIVFSHVTKIYKGGVTALDDVSFPVGSGVFGLLGHNGAGKSTLMKALVTVEPPSSGTIQVRGFDTVHQGREVRKAPGLPASRAAHVLQPVCERLPPLYGGAEGPPRQGSGGECSRPGGNAELCPAEDRPALRGHEAESGHRPGAAGRAAHPRGG